MKYLSIAILIASTSACFAGEEIRSQDEISPSVCGHQPLGMKCSELVVIGGIGDNSFTVLEIGPGGYICGPAVVRAVKDGLAALTLEKGVCIPRPDPQ
jgi:hypothetical protein